ncbi:MAG TPA: Crp/Fnr family transcriptional regulator [Pyrinomonadaceae bacterium]|nr:Crp/Fnr family transcriptional regulator [Pyrinomonadaceae bacterium]
MPNGLNHHSIQIDNHILRSLPPSDFERISPHVQLNHSEVLYEPDQPIDSVYFPNFGIVSLVANDVEGQSVEVGIVGFEGVVGLSVALATDKSPYQVLVQLPNSGFRMSARAFQDEFKRAGVMHDLVLRYTHSLLMHTSQLAVCNRLHSLSERLARWLLMSYDRCKCVDLPFTHEFLSLMLGVRRAGVTEAAIVLQTEGYIKYRRGHITIIDKEGLEVHTCDCYAVLKKDFYSVVDQ